MGDHWLAGKGGYFDASYRIPLIVRDPRASADASRGAVVRAFTENIDIMPTMLQAIGIPVPLQCDGADLAPILESGEVPEAWRDAAHWEFDFRDPSDETPETRLGLTMHQCALNVIRDEAFKYVHFTRLPPLLFDLAADPDEMTNVAEDPAYLAVTLKYAQKMLSWRMNHDEQTLTHIALTDEGLVSRPAPRY
jgi:arylsulfatase A-like enzyme